MSDARPEDAPPPRRDPRAAPAGVWVTSTYFAEGFPYTVVNTLAEALFKELGASLKEIGLTSLFHLPWNLKFLWGPFLDRYETKRSWLVFTEVAITVLLVALAFSATTSTVLAAASVLFMLLAVLSATHDIAIDGFYLEGLDSRAQSRWVGMRAAAYRSAMFVVSSPLLLLVGWAHERLGDAGMAWMLGFGAAALMMALLTASHQALLPRVEARGRPVGELVGALMQARTGGVALMLVLGILGVRAGLRSDPFQAAWAVVVEAMPFLGKLGQEEWIALALLATLVGVALALASIKRKLTGQQSFYATAFVAFLDQRRVGAILAFIILFRTGESFLLKMRYAFLRDIGMSIEQIATASGTVGLFASIGATIAGGWLISRFGLLRCIWPMVLAQNTLNLLYMYLAWRHEQLSAVGAAVGYWEATSIIAIEAAGAGLGTAVFMVYLLRCCRPGFKAAHMAILTALMSLGFTLGGVASGFLAEALGYRLYFGMTFLATVPGMALIFFIPYLDGSTAEDASSRDGAPPAAPTGSAPP